MFSAKIISNFCISAVFFLFATFAQANVVNIDNDELKALLDQGIPIVDVRRVDEWNSTGIVEKSHLITFFDDKGQYDADAWLTELKAIAKSDEPVILICRSGARTRMISQWLSEKQGHSTVYNVSKGILEWIGGDNETVSP